METADGLDYATVENELAAMESRAAFALRKFLDSPSGNRKIEPDLSACVGWLTVRMPWFRRAAEYEWQRFLERVAGGREPLPDDPDFSFSLVSVTTGEQRRFALGEAVVAIKSGSWQARLSKNQMIDAMRVQAWYFRFQHFSRLHWTVLTAPDGQFFLTSDRPVVWYVPGRGLADSPAALKQPGVELTVSLSRRFALLATPTSRPPRAEFDHQISTGGRFYSVRDSWLLHASARFGKSPRNNWVERDAADHASHPKR